MLDVSITTVGFYDGFGTYNRCAAGMVLDWGNGTTIMETIVDNSSESMRV